MSESHYDLYPLSGPAKFRLSLKDPGVTLDDSGLAFRADGDSATRAYADIASVTVNSNRIGGRAGPIGNCTIQFRGDVPKLVIGNVGASGLADRNRTPAYRAFLKDFHARLVAAGVAAKVDFRAGYGTARYRLLWVSLVAAAALFVALPIALLVITSDPRTLWILLAGIVLVAPAAQLVGPNRPRSYDPADPPDLVK